MKLLKIRTSVWNENLLEVLGNLKVWWYLNKKWPNSYVDMHEARRNIRFCKSLNKTNTMEIYKTVKILLKLIQRNIKNY